MFNKLEQEQKQEQEQELDRKQEQEQYRTEDRKTLFKWINIPWSTDRVHEEEYTHMVGSAKRNDDPKQQTDL